MLCLIQLNCGLLPKCWSCSSFFPSPGSLPCLSNHMPAWWFGSIRWSHGKYIHSWLGKPPVAALSRAHASHSRDTMTRDRRKPAHPIAGGPQWAQMGYKAILHPGCPVWSQVVAPALWSHKIHLLSLQQGPTEMQGLCMCFKPSPSLPSHGLLKVATR